MTLIVCGAQKFHELEMSAFIFMGFNYFVSFTNLGQTLRLSLLSFDIEFFFGCLQFLLEIKFFLKSFIVDLGLFFLYVQLFL